MIFHMKQHQTTACGADYPNMARTDSWSHVSCLECLWKIPDGMTAIRDPSLSREQGYNIIVPSTWVDVLAKAGLIWKRGDLWTWGEKQPQDLFRYLDDLTAEGSKP